MGFEPLFLTGAAGQLFGLYFPPQGGERGGWGVAYVPPFAEEMNQSRRMVTLQARKLAAAGIGVLLLDLYGTGDSAGEFSEARWDTWLADVAVALDFLEGRGLRPALWGLRLGGLLAAQAAAKQPARVRRVVLWQPVLNGETYLTQFLRLRVAAAMSEAEPKETTSGLREKLIEDGLLEVAGYDLSSELALAIDAATLSAQAPASDCDVTWFELASRPDASVSPGARRVVDGWREAGAKARLSTVVGERFWSIQEPAMVPALWDATLASWSDGTA